MKETNFEQLYVEAAKKVFGHSHRAETWVDDNTHILNKKVKSVDEAVEDIKRFL